MSRAASQDSSLVPAAAGPPAARPPAARSILVLCEGNHCRSPLAEGLLREALGSGFRVESAGLTAQDGYAPHYEAIRLAAERGVDITHLRSRRFRASLAASADLVLVMDRDEADRCERIMPELRGRVFLLGHWLPEEQQEIPDPFDQPKETFGRVFEAIHQAVCAWQHALTIPGTI